MQRHPGLPPERSGSNEFFSDANLNLRAEAASYSDFAPLPGEIAADALASSGALQAHAAAGGALTPLMLADVEVDDGSRSADLADDYLSMPASPYGGYAPPPAATLSDESNLDRLADLLIDRMTKRLGGN